MTTLLHLHNARRARKTLGPILPERHVPESDWLDPKAMVTGTIFFYLAVVTSSFLVGYYVGIAAWAVWG